MKTKSTLVRFALGGGATLLFLFAGLFKTGAQDPRERYYYYEILEPHHAPKPQVEGFATMRVNEALDRGLTATRAQDGQSLYLSWRLLAEDPQDVAFDVIRVEGQKNQRLNKRPITATCDFIVENPPAEAVYKVVPRNNRKSVNSAGAKAAANPGTAAASPDKTKGVLNTGEGSISIRMEDLPAFPYLSIKLRDGVRPGKMALADLNGDGIYDYIIRTPDSSVDPGMPGDLAGRTYQIEAYLSDGTFLWSFDLGQGIEPGVWYSPFICYDFNGDGKAEVALKTAPGDIVRNEKGRVDYGDEYLSVLDGMTGREIDRVDWPVRNFRYGDLNRQSRHQIGMAFLDGKTPYILAARGTYKLMTVDAWMLRGDKLELAWRWDGDEENPVVRSMGAHNMICTDVDGDGRDEVVLGSCALDDNGTLLWSTGLGHPDKIFISDIDPNRPGMEMLLCLEPWHDNGRGVCMIDPKDGSPIWNIGHKTYHVGDGMVADFDPSSPGLECFASEDQKGGSSDKYLLSADGRIIGKNEEVPPCRNWAWWDADLLREYISAQFYRSPEGRFGRKSGIGKWKGETLFGEMEGGILMIADVFGDWREEIITALPGELRVYTTNIPARDRRITLMQDALYRNYVAHRSMGYDQAPVPSFYLGE